jgi:hypothetical protein
MNIAVMSIGVMERPFARGFNKWSPLSGIVQVKKDIFKMTTPAGFEPALPKGNR